MDNPLNSHNNSTDNSSLNWEDIQWQIPTASEPNHPLEFIKNCLTDQSTPHSTSLPNPNTFDSNLDPYDQIDKQFNIYMESLKKRFKELR